MFLWSIYKKIKPYAVTTEEIDAVDSLFATLHVVASRKALTFNGIIVIF